MTAKINTKTVDKGMYKNFLQKAEENLKIDYKALEERAYNPAAVNAVHSAISAADAFCVYYLGKRCTSAKHEDAADLIMDIPVKDDEKTVISKMFRTIIRIKNMVEYEERLVKPKEAEKVVNEAKKLLELVKIELKEE